MKKDFEFWVLLNWKNGNVKALKRFKHGKIGNPYELPVKMNLKVETPELRHLDIEAEMTIPQPVMDTILIHEIVGEEKNEKT